MSYRRAWLLVDEMNRCFVRTGWWDTVGGRRHRTRRDPE